LDWASQLVAPTSGTYAGRVGVGTTSPQSIFHVASSSSQLLIGYLGSSINYTDGNVQHFRLTGGTPILDLTSGGATLFNTTVPSATSGAATLVANAGILKAVNSDGTTGDVVLTAGAQTITGSKTFSNLYVGTGGGQLYYLFLSR
jgi:hypothetical protein